MTERIADDDGTTWMADHESSTLPGKRGRVVFASPTGERRARQCVDLGLLVFEGKADEDALLQALNESRPE